MPDPLTAIDLRHTPQTEQADPRQVPNNAGGHTFTVAPIERLRRFLVLGTDGGTYYTSEQELTRDNAGMLPDAALTEPAVWEALIHNGMPQTALIRQLPRLTGRGGLHSTRCGNASGWQARVEAAELSCVCPPFLNDRAPRPRFAHSVDCPVYRAVWGLDWRSRRMV